MVLVPPGPCPPAPALAARKLHLQGQFTVCTLLLLSQLNPSSLPGPQPDFRISLSLSPSLSVCASCLSATIPPTFPPCCGAYTHLYHVHSLSTNWHLLGSDRDTKTKLGTNPSKPNYLVQTSWSQDRRLRTTCLLALTPRPVQLLLSLCVLEARTSCFLGPLPSLFLFNCNARNYQTLTHTYILGRCSAHVPRALSLDTRCDVQPATFTLDHTPA